MESNNNLTQQFRSSKIIVPTEPKKLRVLVTGADGMLGSNLVRLLLKQHFEVSVFLHPSSGIKTLKGLKIKKHFGDILNRESLELAVCQTDYLIHAAALTTVWPNRSKLVRKVNIEGTRNVITLAIKYKIKRMIYIGSAGARITSGQYRYAGEKYGLDYIESKYEALRMVLDAVKNQKLPALAILPTYMIGAYDSLPGSGKLITAQAKGKLFFCPKGGRNFVNVEDVATAIANSLKLGKIGKAYVAGNENLSYQLFLKKVADVTGKDEPRIKTPSWLVKTIGRFGSLSGKLLNKPPTISYTMARISCDYHYVTSDEAVKELKMPQTKIELAINKSYEWLRANGYC